MIESTAPRPSTRPGQARRTAALAFIFVTVLIDVLAFGLIIPVLPHLIEGFTGGDTASAAYWVGLFGTVFAVIQFVTAPIQGALSDRHGRRPVILLSCLGLGLDFIFMALANSLPWLLMAALFPASRRPASPPPMPMSPTSPRRSSAPGVTA